MSSYHHPSILAHDHESTISYLAYFTYNSAEFLRYRFLLIFFFFFLNDPPPPEISPFPPPAPLPTRGPRRDRHAHRQGEREREPELKPARHGGTPHRLRPRMPGRWRRRRARRRIRGGTNEIGRAHV